MVVAVRCLEDAASLPPPRKILRRGTTELEDALENGEVELSLPQHELTSWMGRSPGWKHATTITKEESKQDKFQDSTTSTEVSTSRSAAGQTTNDDGQEETVLQEPQQTKSKSKDIISTKFSDIIGHSHVKLRLEEVLLPLALPPQLADSILTGVRSNSASILMYGPPGCGKTQLAKAVAGEAEAALLSVGPSDILSKFVGESEASIRSLFDKARDQAQKMESKCAVLFFDEIDALGQSRGGNGTSHSEQGGGDGCSRRVLAELLIQLNRINSLKGGVEDESSPTSQTVHFETGDTDSVDTVYEDETSCIESVEADPSARVRIIVVAATNRPEDCDPALVRRFSVRVIVGLPSLRDRKKIIKRYLKGIGSSISQEQLQEIAAATDGWSGSDLESLTREAAMAPVRDCIRSAALLKRRRPHREQRRGISSCQVDALPMNDDSYEEEHEKLLEQFRNLRHVTFEDFEDAIAFWTLNHNPNTPSAVGRISPRSLAHYDSSSDEDD